MAQLDASFMASPYKTLQGSAIDEMFHQYPVSNKKDKDTILCILASCWDAYAINKKNNIWVSISFNFGFYSHYGAYGVPHWTIRRVKSAFQYLLQNKLINKMPSLAPKPGYAGKRTRVKISKKLLKLLTSSNLDISTARLNKPQILIKKKIDLGYNEMNVLDKPPTSKQYISIKNNVSEINIELLKHNFGLIQGDPTPLQATNYHYPYNVDDLRNNDLQIRLQRMFSDPDLTKHGRYYTNLQSMPSKQRLLLTIDGEGVVEVDYRGLHYNIAYNLNGLDMKQYPYEHPTIPKDLFKKACIITLNTHSKRSASGAIRKRIEDPDLPPNCRGFSSQEVLAAVIEKHPAIENNMFKDMGMEYMNMDSRIATDVLNHFISLGEGILPVHDSFVVRKSMQQELINIMNKSYKNHLNFEP